MSEQRAGRQRHSLAVVIIHGIGEQRPMDTLRGFVESVLSVPKQGGEKYYSRPDPLSESFELRVLQNREQPRVHFFEYYWADKVSGSKYKHVLAWITTLLFRPPWKVPGPLLPVWILAWLLAAFVIFAAPSGLLERINQGTLQSPSGVLSLISLGVVLLIQGFTVDFVGDVARYLNAAPDNIKIRQAIRADGIKLLRSIHECGEYERVIVVGHSLGSFIAYDILKHAWQEYHKTYTKPKASSQDAMRNLETIGEKLQNGESGVTLDMYMQAQIELWKELRGLGNPWLVTDLITMGSPLTYGRLVLASDKADLERRQRQGELPTNPPQAETRGRRKFYSYRVWEPYGEKNDIRLDAIHTAGFFAMTRWTNLYFPIHAGFFGDLAGGPLTDFGKGIRNIPVMAGKVLTDWSILAHTSYWSAKPMESVPETNAMRELKRALDLDNESYYDEGVVTAATFESASDATAARPETQPADGR